jgi:sugar lactone lactonase YvrE
MRLKGYILFGLLSMVMLSGCGNFEWFPGPLVALSITTTTLPNATAGVPYSASIAASGGTSPYKWQLTGTLPAGLTLNSSSGVISGIPTGTAGSFTVSVTDSGSPVSTVTQTYTINVLIGGSVQGKSPAFANATSCTVTTFAGTAGTSGAADGTGTAATFFNPIAITTDGTNLYLADSNNNTIRKIVITTGVVTTIAGDSTANPGSADGIGTAARFNAPAGITTDGTNLYVTDTGNNIIRQIVIATGAVTTLAGSTKGVAGSADGIGTTATFDIPYGITTDGVNLYVADSNNSTIRQIVIATKVVTTIAGSAGITGTTDGTGATALFSNPMGMTTDGTNLYVADTANNIIRQIVIATKVVTTIAGTATSFNFPAGLTTDGINLYVADTLNYTIQMIALATKAVTTIAGTAGTNGTTDGPGSVALFDTPNGCTTDGISLYVVDNANHTIRRIQ